MSSYLGWPMCFLTKKSGPSFSSITSALIAPPSTALRKPHLTP